LDNRDGKDRECQTQPGDRPFPLENPICFERGFLGAGHAIQQSIGKQMISRCVVLPADYGLVRLAHQNERGFEAIVNFKFVENIGEVRLHRLLANEDLPADFFIGQPLGD
jgi:hypothetical protein